MFSHNGIQTFSLTKNVGLQQYVRAVNLNLLVQIDLQIQRFKIPIPVGSYTRSYLEIVHITTTT